VDRAALAEPEATASPEKAAAWAPRPAIEQRIFEVWEKVLGKDGVGVEDNFFEVGGDSLQLIEVHSELEKVFHAKISITDLFAYTTIGSLAAHMASQVCEPPAFAEIQDRARKQQEALARQKRMWVGQPR
jgi:acyl carrier protein